MKAMLFDIERNSYVDGPGIRTTVFFKGCNLTCKWCHNPESQNYQKEIFFYKNKCLECGKCTALTVDNKSFFCLNDAKKICGKEYDLDEVYFVIEKDKPFYKNSGGGVTFSGGECMLQIEYLEKLLKKCKENDIHTAVDTAGNVPWGYFEKILPYTDLFLYDIKTMDNEIHRQNTGAGNELILKNLEKLLQLKIPIWVRIPVIPGVNDTKENMESIKCFFDKNGYPEKIEFLPYHAMGEHKYNALGRVMVPFDKPNAEMIEELRNIVVR